MRHGVVALGAFLAVVALVLVPHGVKELSPVSAGFWFTAGAVAFLGRDIFVTRKQSTGSQRPC